MLQQYLKVKHHQHQNRPLNMILNSFDQSLSLAVYPSNVHKMLAKLFRQSSTRVFSNKIPLKKGGGAAGVAHPV